MSEFREVSEDEAVSPRPSIRMRSFHERRELLWPGEVQVMMLYCAMWLVWRVVVGYVTTLRSKLGKWLRFRTAEEEETSDRAIQSTSSSPELSS